MRKGVDADVVDIDVTKLKLSNGRTIAQQMQYEASRFIRILQEEIDIWYHSYSPEEYQRTYKMRNCIYAENYVKVDLNASKLSIRIRFTDEAYHKSLWGNQEVNTLLLMNNGYHVSNGWHKDIPYFGYREGGHFLEKAVLRFNADNNFGITVEVDYQGKE